MLAIKDLGEAVRPLGLKCFSDEECKQNLSEDVIVELFRKAVQIQKEHMIQSLATVTLLYMPSYEVLGYVLLAFDSYEAALEMFETSLAEKMGRTLSLLGLARRSHRMMKAEMDLAILPAFFQRRKCINVFAKIFRNVLNYL